MNTKIWGSYLLTVTWEHSRCLFKEVGEYPEKIK